MFVAWGPELLCFYNDAYRPMLGYRLNTALGRPFREVWASIWDEIEPLVDATLAGESRTMTNMALDLSRGGVSEESWWTFTYSPVFDDGGEIAGLLCVTSETTAQISAEKGLRDLAESLEQKVRERTAEFLLHQNIVQSDQAPICAFDKDCRLIAFNRAHSDDFYRIYGHRVQIGDHFPSLFLPDQAAVIEGFMMRALRGERFTVVEEFGDPDLEKPHWEVSYSPLRGEDGGIYGAFHHAQDITDRIRAQAELEEAQEALRQSQKMEAVGQLTGGIAHDFNNLLTIIRGSIDLLRRPDLASERRTRYLDAVSDTADRASKLTGQLLAFARRQALKPETFDVGARLCAIAEMLNPLLGASTQINVDAAPDRFWVHADAPQFETALINIAVNARDAMDGIGTLTLTLRGDQPLPPVRGHAGVQGSFVAIELTDTGSGIEPERLEQIFEPFFTTKIVGKGTGLGLSQVFGFAKQSGGEIDVRSTIGSGSTFTLYLPQATRPRAEATNVEQIAGCGEGQRILVVEDNLDVGRFATGMLTDLGFENVWVTNAEQALEQLASPDHGFDVVFSDVVMPGMGGIALAREIKARRIAVPVILASGYSHVLAEEGVQQFTLLRKPYSAEQLVSAFARASTAGE